MFIDSHCHIFKEYYDDISSIIERAKKNNVSKLIISGCDKKSIIEGIDIIENYPNVYMTIGFHPDEVDNVDDKDILWLERLLEENNKIIGVGEIGLDYHFVKDKKEKQKELFNKQLDIAEKLNLPIVIHSRDATQDTYDILKKRKLFGIIHCFSSSKEMANLYIKLGYKIGIGGVLTFKNSNLSEVVKNINLENITLETDSPYLAPTPFRGKQNSPEYIPIIAERIASIKNVNIEEVGRITTNNVNTLFDLK